MSRLYHLTIYSAVERLTPPPPPPQKKRGLCWTPGHRKVIQADAGDGGAHGQDGEVSAPSQDLTPRDGVGENPGWSGQDDLT